MMIDLCPIFLDASIDILYKAKEEFVGLADMSPDIQTEINSDRAIAAVLSDELYRQLTTDWFEIAYYWDTVRGMVADLHERWKEDVYLDG